MHLSKNLNLHTWILTLIILLTSITRSSAQSLAYKRDYLLVFQDEYNKYDYKRSFWDNAPPFGRYVKGLHFVTDDENFNYTDSTLDIETRKEKYAGTYIIDYTETGEAIYKTDTFDYTTGMLYSDYRLLYGLFEIKFKAPKGKGNNAAFWMYGPDNTEIDFFEIVGSNTNKATFNLHWDGDDPLTGSSQRPEPYTLPDGSFSDSFNTITCSWDTNSLQWWVNDIEIKHNFFNSFIWNRHIPNIPLNLIITNEVGTLDGNPDESSVFPNTFEIDYVRVYQKKDTLAPKILGQTPQSTTTNYFVLKMDMLQVEDAHKTYPYGFRIDKELGEGYYIKNDTVFIETPTTFNKLIIPLTVNDGVKNSNSYPFEIALDPILSIKEKNYGITYTIKNNTLIVNSASRVIDIKNFNLIGQEITLKNEQLENTYYIKKKNNYKGLTITIIRTKDGVKRIKW